MELRQLRYFVACVDHGSLSRAALVLHIAQPALTQQLRQLEEELGAQLLHRSAQGVTATDAGKVFYEHAQAILKQVGDARQAVTQSTTRPSGAVTLGLPHSISGALALPLLLAVQQTYPEIILQLTEELSGNLAEQLKSGRINLAVLFDDGQLSQFSTTPLVEEEMHFLWRANSRFGKRRRNIPLAQAVTVPLILPDLQHGVRPRIENTVRDAGLKLERVIEINSVTILKSAILADMGGTILPVAPLQDEVERGRILSCPVVKPSLARAVALCASKSIPLTTAAAAVARLVLDVSRDLCDSGRWVGARMLD